MPERADRSPTPGNDALKPRYMVVDMLRGFALLIMFGYHFCFDLRMFGALSGDFNKDLFWLGYRAVIVSLFLVTMGMSLTLATSKGLRRKPFLRRAGIIAACALVVSAASWVMFPKTVIFFGVLHFIVVASFLGLAFRRFLWPNLVLGAGVIVLGVCWSHPIFDLKGLQWVGLMTRKPVTEDYVPLIPWFGVVLVGMFLAGLVYGRGRPPAWAAKEYTGRASRLLALMGRHSLLLYMAHQPVFMGVLWVVFKAF